MSCYTTRPLISGRVFIPGTEVTKGSCHCHEVKLKFDTEVIFLVNMLRSVSLLKII